MSKRQFFLGMLLASLIGGMVALVGVSFLIQPNSATSFDDKQPISFANLLSGEEFTIPDGINFVASAEAVVPAVVHVKSQITYAGNGRSRRDPMQEYFGIPPRENQGDGRSPEGRTMMSSGSGVIISPDGYIVTNNHVVENATRLEISLDNNKRYVAKVIGTDPTTDL